MKGWTKNKPNQNKYLIASCEEDKWGPVNDIQIENGSFELNRFRYLRFVSSN